LYCSVLSLGGNVNTRRMSKPDMGSIFHIKISMKYSGQRKLLCELSKLSKFNAFNLLGYYTNTDASIRVYKFRRELLSLCTQSIRNCINFPSITTLIASFYFTFPDRTQVDFQVQLVATKKWTNHTRRHKSQI